MEGVLSDQRSHLAAQDTACDPFGARGPLRRDTQRTLPIRSKTDTLSWTLPVTPLWAKSRDVIEYRTGNDLNLDLVLELYRASTLAERRPVQDRERMRTMLENANLVVTAWEGELLVGIARSLSDFSYCTYLSDLAVRQSHQRQGIGRGLIRRTRELGRGATIILLAAPKAVDYYPRIGFTQHPQAWILPATNTEIT